MTSTTKKEPGHFRRNWLFYSLLVVSVASSSYLYVSKNLTVSKQHQAFTLEKELIYEQANELFHINSEKHLEILMKPLIWAVRSELVKGNQEQVAQYFNQLVKAENFEEISLLDTKGEILISTNKKNEGSQLSAEYAASILKIEELTIIDKGERQIVAAPIITSDGHLGILLLVSKKGIFRLEQKVNLTANK